MPEADWNKLLRNWSDRLITADDGAELPPQARQKCWLGLPGATDEQIAALEERLKIPLPPSYRAFLKLTNGWLKLDQAIDCVRSVENVRWFRDENKDWIAAFDLPTPYGEREDVPDKEYFSYAAPQDFRCNHLKATLQISDVGDAAVLLLNPQVIDAQGEWEAWFLATWLPGAHRFRSFWEMMECRFNQAFNLEWQQPVGLVGALPEEYIGFPGSPKRHAKKRRRRQGVKVLNKPLEQWDVAELIDLLSYEDGYVRDEAAWALGKLNDPRAIKPLLEMLDHEESGPLSAMYALKDLAPDLVVAEDT